MDGDEREAITQRLAEAFGDAIDVTPEGDSTPHILLPKLELPPPWKPSPTRGLTVFENWPTARPLFFIDEGVVGEGGEPPRSNHTSYRLGETWRGYSFNFPWSGHDPVVAIQLWLGRFTAERS